MPTTYDGYVVTFDGKMIWDTFGKTPKQAKWRLLMNSRPFQRTSDLTDADLDRFWRGWENEGLRIARARLEVMEPVPFEAT